MNVIKEINSITRKEIQHQIGLSGSWHDDYKDSAYVYIGGLPYELTEGDIICIFSQYGEIVNINLVKDKDSGKSKGFSFLQYEDQRSTILAVDNLNGAKVLGRTLRVDHVKNYKQPKLAEDDDNIDGPPMNALPKPIESRKVKDKDSRIDKMKKYGIDPEDPMAEYLYKKRKSEKSKLKKK
ncbi:hypothetical protein BB561_005931 [Smittium simulii]|uniref:RRM domain-containing protein n=1 Tax=Smittium simulii TaxID=133385 RepID=A0A2T9Y7G0_9FUNG|nr:hypothetical protein BB561_005931 [Smittium simulii]